MTSRRPRLVAVIATVLLSSLASGQAQPTLAPPSPWLLSLPSASALGLPPLPSPRLVPIPAGDDRFVPLLKDQAAPFAGHLFDAATAMRWGNYLEQCRVRLDVDVRSERERGQVEASFWRTRAEQDRLYYGTVLSEQQKQIDRLTLPPGEPPLYARGWFLYGLGLVTASVVFGAGAYAIHR